MTFQSSLPSPSPRFPNLPLKKQKKNLNSLQFIVVRLETSEFSDAAYNRFNDETIESNAKYAEYLIVLHL